MYIYIFEFICTYKYMHMYICIYVYYDIYIYILNVYIYYVHHDFFEILAPWASLSPHSYSM